MLADARALAALRCRPGACASSGARTGGVPTPTDSVPPQCLPRPPPPPHPLPVFTSRSSHRAHLNLIVDAIGQPSFTPLSLLCPFRLRCLFSSADEVIPSCFFLFFPLTAGRNSCSGRDRGRWGGTEFNAVVLGIFELHVEVGEMSKRCIFLRLRPFVLTFTQQKCLFF